NAQRQMRRRSLEQVQFERLLLVEYSESDLRRGGHRRQLPLCEGSPPLWQMTGANGWFDLADEFSKFTEVFAAPRADFEMNIYHLLFFAVQRILDQSYHLFIFQMVVSEPDFRRQVDRYRRMVSSSLKRLVKQKLAGSAIRNVLGESE